MLDKLWLSFLRATEVDELNPFANKATLKGIVQARLPVLEVFEYSWRVPKSSLFIMSVESLCQFTPVMLGIDTVTRV